MANALIVNDILDKFELNLNEFCAKCGLPYSTIYNAIRRKSELSVDSLNKIASQFTQLSKEWLLTGKGEMLISKPKTPYSEPGKRIKEARDQAGLSVDEMVESLNKIEGVAIAKGLYESIEAGTVINPNFVHLMAIEQCLGLDIMPEYFPDHAQFFKRRESRLKWDSDNIGKKNSGIRKEYVHSPEQNSMPMDEFLRRLDDFINVIKSQQETIREQAFKIPDAYDRPKQGAA